MRFVAKPTGKAAPRTDTGNAAPRKERRAGRIAPSVPSIAAVAALAVASIIAAPTDSAQAYGSGGVVAATGSATSKSTAVRNARLKLFRALRSRGCSTRTHVSIRCKRGWLWACTARARCR
ncbi:MAG: hypothetical protein MRY74_05400 [Neomegalonema sp.]|nr:hypothetical protein [Neomegalonema sp.]